MFRRPNNNNSNSNPSGQTGVAAIERVTSVLGPGINWRGSLRGSGGVRIEGTFEGDMQIRGMIVVGETGRVTCMNMRANTIVVEGTVRGNITAEKLEIRSTGRVWGDVSVISFSTEDGAFLRGQVRMEEKVVIEQQTDMPQQGPQQGPQQQVPPANPGINYFPR
ncbi:MAG: polymer-forming cytoskeletal protein [Flexilinea sp.]|nr:polymer-forming cytoskeletal protein [Flexilinea sp.]